MGGDAAYKNEKKNGEKKWRRRPRGAGPMGGKLGPPPPPQKKHGEREGGWTRGGEAGWLAGWLLWISGVCVCVCVCGGQVVPGEGGSSMACCLPGCLYGLEVCVCACVCVWGGGCVHG